MATADHGVVDHRALLKSLAAEERRLLTTLSDTPALRQLALHLGLIVVFGGLIAAGAPGWQVLMVPYGILIVFLFTALHETSHGTAFKTAWINVAVAQLAGFLVLVPPTWFKHFHFAHHRHTHDPKRDPELEAGEPETFWQYVRHLSGLPLWRSMIVTTCRNAVGRIEAPYLPTRARPEMVREARVMLLSYLALALASVAAGSTILLWIWVVPIVLGQPFLRAYLLAEHARCPAVANMLENTRTTFTTGLVRFLAWNMPFHAEHHAVPAVPFHRLPALHRHAEAHLRQTEDGYVRFNKKFARAVGKEAALTSS